jgi:hypothetical protein
VTWQTRRHKKGTVLRVTLQKETQLKREIQQRRGILLKRERIQWRKDRKRQM